jgi:peptide deformylase
VSADEGCLSVPGFYERVERAEQINVQAQDVTGAPMEMSAEGLLAVCIQHECDHLDGKLFVDYLSSLKRSRINKKLRQLASDRG